MTAVFEGKVALVTGAGGGIGLATAEAFAKAGASVIVADRDEETIGKAAEGLRAAGHNAIGVTCDVTDTAQVEAMIERAVSTYGRLDAAFNNAGVNSEAAAFLETSDDEFERVMNVNLRGVWNCMKGELRQMMAQGSGAIVNCSSIGGLKGSRGRSAYSASKHAVIGLTRSAALDYAAKGIRINAVCPGMVNTPMAVFVTKNYDPEIVSRMVAQEPIGRFGEPEEIAAAVVWLCSPAASFMVGHAMAVDGGLLVLSRRHCSRSVGRRSGNVARQARQRVYAAKLRVHSVKPCTTCAPNLRKSRPDLMDTRCTAILTRRFDQCRRSGTHGAVLTR